MKFSELRKQRATTPIPVTLADGQEVHIFYPTVDGIRKVLRLADEQKSSKGDNEVTSGSKIMVAMLQACTQEDLTEDEAEQAIYDTGGPTSPLIEKLSELIYGREASAALKADPLPSGGTSGSPTSES